MFDDNYVELDEYIEQIDEAKNKNKNKKFSKEEIEEAQDFVDTIDLEVE